MLLIHENFKVNISIWDSCGHLVHWSFCLFVFLSFCLFVFLSFCLFVFLSFCLFVFLSCNVNQSINQCLLLKQQPIGFSKRVRLFKQSHCVSNKNRLGETNITENSKYIQQRHRGKCGTRTETGTAQTSPTSTTTQSKGTTPPRTQAGALHNCAAQLSSC